MFANSQRFLQPLELSSSTELVLMLISVVIAVLAVLISLRNYTKGLSEQKIAENKLYKFIQNKYYIDEAYDFLFVKPIRGLGNLFYRIFDLKVIDGIVNGSGRFFEGLSADWRKLQTGIIQDYAVISVGGIILILLYVLFLK